MSMALGSRRLFKHIKSHGNELFNLLTSSSFVVSGLKQRIGCCPKVAKRSLGIFLLFLLKVSDGALKLNNEFAFHIAVASGLFFFNEQKIFKNIFIRLKEVF